MDLFDVAVIGAGPAGSMAAKYSAKSGARTILLEEHAGAGWPVQCAGLLGQEAMAESEISSRSIVLQAMRGATVFSPGCRRLDFKAKAAKAWVVDRRLFDQAMLAQAVAKGAELRIRSNVRKIRRERGYSILTLAGGREIKSKIVISAEGVSARIARQAGISRSQMILSGAQVQVPFAVEDPEKVEVHLGVAPGLFGWVIPLDEGSSRIGLCARDRGCERLRSFLKTDIIKKRLRGSPVALNVGGLPLGPAAVTAVDGLLAVGDAAGQVKPTSGGGIYPGLVAAKIAGGVAAAAAIESECTALRLMEYDRLWRAALGRELEIGMRANRMLSRMSDAELDELVGYLAAKPRLIKAIEEHGDIDRPSLLMARMMRHLDWDAIRLARLLGYALR
ncbi:MAG: Digeranylgeranylglycerophospholipid reductase [Methanosaeta sp. PtaU1.Bin112]|nr:MAG: Digeranylgeranylglycerophospholipid reductase [Methanosaeta sp. PtaU1.Bin112]